MARARTKDAQAIRDFAKTIKSVDDVKPHVKVGVYGPNGSGKTRFAASAPKCLILDINEEGTRSAVGSGAKVAEINTWEDIGNAYWYLKALTDKKSPRYESVAIDTVSAMNSLALAFVLGQKTGTPDPSEERTQPDKRSYGRSGELVKGMLLAFRNLPLHVIFLAQVRTIRDDDTGEVEEFAYDLPQGSRATATSCVSVLGFMQQRKVKVKGKRVLQSTMRLQPTDEMPYLKDRTNSLGALVRQPTMPQVIEAWALNPPDQEEQ